MVACSSTTPRSFPAARASRRYGSPIRSRSLRRHQGPMDRPVALLRDRSALVLHLRVDGRARRISAEHRVNRDGHQRAGTHALLIAGAQTRWRRSATAHDLIQLHRPRSAASGLVDPQRRAADERRRTGNACKITSVRATGSPLSISSMHVRAGRLSASLRTSTQTTGIDDDHRGPRPRRDWPRSPSQCTLPRRSSTPSRRWRATSSRGA